MKTLYYLPACLLFFLLRPVIVPAQEADSLLKAVANTMDKIIRFEADAVIHVDVDFINIKDTRLKVKYESPDKFTFDVQGLALLPKKGMQMDYMQMLNAKYTAIDVGKELIGTTETRIIKVIPESEDADVILAQLWIDPKTKRILRMKTYTRKSGSYTIDFEYDTPYRPLPDVLTVNFEINNMTFPTKAMNEIMTNGIQKPDSIPKKATVVVRYSNYKIVSK
jgi:outer membrane lipoprotein-sorting protein